jgi:hypothetical protein
MLLFGRFRTINTARARAALAFSTEVAGRVREVIGHDVYTWTTIFSPNAGTVLWSARFENLADLETASDKLAVADDYLDSVEQADSLFVGPMTDVLSEVVHGTPDPSPASYLQVVQAVCRTDKLAEGMAFGAEIADAAMRATGRSCLFTSSMTGAFGGVSWLLGAPDAAAIQKANADWAGDTGAQELMAKVGDHYQPGGTITLLRRLA